MPAIVARSTRRTAADAASPIRRRVVAAPSRSTRTSPAPSRQEEERRKNLVAEPGLEKIRGEEREAAGEKQPGKAPQWRRNECGAGKRGRRKEKRHSDPLDHRRAREPVEWQVRLDAERDHPREEGAGEQPHRRDIEDAEPDRGEVLDPEGDAEVARHEEDRGLDRDRREKAVRFQPEPDRRHQPGEEGEVGRRRPAENPAPAQEQPRRHKENEEVLALPEIQRRQEEHQRRDEDEKQMACPGGGAGRPEEMRREDEREKRQREDAGLKDGDRRQAARPRKHHDRR